MLEKHGSASTESGVNKCNEDSYLVDDTLGLYAVCDGDSGAAAGEVASKIAAESIKKYIKKYGKAFSNLVALKAIRFAFSEIYAKESSSKDLLGMSTTLTMLLIKNNIGLVGHVGDSRLYLAREGSLSLLTTDHELTHNTEEHHESIYELEIDTFRFSYRPGDIFILCTDGLNKVMEDEALVLKIIETFGANQIGSKLLDEAFCSDSKQDATVVVVKIDEELERVFHYFSDDFSLFQGVSLAV